MPYIALQHDLAIGPFTTREKAELWVEGNNPGLLQDAHGDYRDASGEVMISIWPLTEPHNLPQEVI